MAEPMVKFDEDLHEQIKNIIATKKVDYPTIQFYVNRAVKNQLRIDTIEIKEQQE
jgi:hypothetical protein